MAAGASEWCQRGKSGLHRAPQRVTPVPLTFNILNVKGGLEPQRRVLESRVGQQGVKRGNLYGEKGRIGPDISMART